MLADEPPGVTDAGLKVAVAPGGIPLAESATTFGNVPFFAATVIEYCTLPPAAMACAAVVDDKLKVGTGGAVPVPLRMTLCGDPAALSATDTVAEKLAAEDGVKLTDIEQDALAANELLQVLISAKSAGLDPAIEIPLMVSATVPVFFSVTV